MAYRFYGFGNYYLSSLQQGLQAGHTVAELFIKNASDTQNAIIADWAKYDKTMILLNGGNSKSLAEIYQLFCKLETLGMDLPFVSFNEDEQSLNGALTYVGIIVPEEIYDMPDYIYKSVEQENPSDWPWEYYLAYKLKQYRLAH